jgi:demethylmenaquinone methyltransferase/2-methoxy-6-polyprenyl-1,4-benzoquinol methylase
MLIPSEFIEKARFVRVIFTDVQREYDALLHTMTLSFDWVWRRRMFSRMSFPQGGRVLDLACGTGLVTFELRNLMGRDDLVVGLDLSGAMLRVSNEKRKLLKAGCPVELVRAVGEFLPFREDVFQYVTVGLALRNFGDKMAVFRETLRVLEGFGWFLSLDFIRTRNPLIWRLYSFHIFHVLPSLGRFVSTYWYRTLVYLANSIAASTPSEVICDRLLEVGFARAFEEKMTLGIVALVRGQK